MPTYRVLAKVHQYEVWYVESDGTAEEVLNGTASYEVFDTDGGEEFAPAEIVEVDSQ